MPRVTAVASLVALLSTVAASCGSSDPCAIEEVAFIRTSWTPRGGIPSGEGIAFDSLGNTYFAAHAAAPLVVQGTTFPSETGDDALLISFDPSGALRWGRMATSSEFAFISDVHVAADDTLFVSVYLSGEPGDAASVFGGGVTLPSSITDYTGYRVVARIGPDGTLIGLDHQPETLSNESGTLTFASGDAATVTTIASGIVRGTSTHACGLTQTAANNQSRLFVCEVDSEGEALQYAEIVATGSLGDPHLTRGGDGQLYMFHRGMQSVTLASGTTLVAEGPRGDSAFVLRFDDELRVVGAVDVGNSFITALDVDESGRMVLSGKGSGPLRGHEFPSCAASSCSILFVAALSADGTLEWITEGGSSDNRAMLWDMVRMANGKYVASGVLGDSPAQFRGGDIRGALDQRFLVEVDPNGAVVSRQTLPMNDNLGWDIATDGEVVAAMGFPTYQPTNTCIGTELPPGTGQNIDFAWFRMLSSQ